MKINRKDDNAKLKLMIDRLVELNVIREGSPVYNILLEGNDPKDVRTFEMNKRIDRVLLDLVPDYVSIDRFKKDVKAEEKIWNAILNKVMNDMKNNTPIKPSKRSNKGSVLVHSGKKYAQDVVDPTKGKSADQLYQGYVEEMDRIHGDDPDMMKILNMK